MLIVLVAVLVAASATPRERRQAGDPGCFWWLSDCGGDVTVGSQNSGDVTVGSQTGQGSTGTTVTNQPTDETRIVNVPPTSNVVKETPHTPCNNNLGECVPYYLCDEGNIITDGAGLIDIRYCKSLVVG